MFTELRFVWFSPLTVCSSRPVKEWLRLLRDSEPDMVAPVRVDPAYLTSWIRMMIANSFHPKVFQKASLTGKDLCRGVPLVFCRPIMFHQRSARCHDVLRATSYLKPCHTMPHWGLANQVFKSRFFLGCCDLPELWRHTVTR